MFWKHAAATKHKTNVSLIIRPNCRFTYQFQFICPIQAVLWVNLQPSAWGWLIWRYTMRWYGAVILWSLDRTIVAMMCINEQNWPCEAAEFTRSCKNHLLHQNVGYFGFLYDFGIYLKKNGQWTYQKIIQYTLICQYNMTILQYSYCPFLKPMQWRWSNLHLLPFFLY